MTILLGGRANNHGMEKTMGSQTAPSGLEWDEDMKAGMSS
jgi:hypothetical protein